MRPYPATANDHEAAAVRGIRRPPCYLCGSDANRIHVGPAAKWVIPHCDSCSDLMKRPVSRPDR